MQHKDKIVLQKILEVIDETAEISINISEEEFLKNNLLKMAILLGIDLLELDKPKKFKNLSANKTTNDDEKN